MPSIGSRLSALGYCHEYQSFWLKINVWLFRSLYKYLRTQSRFEQEACQY